MSDGVLGSPYPPELVRAYTDAGWWGSTTPADLVLGHARATPHATAFTAVDTRLDWAGYAALAHDLAEVLAAAGVRRGDRVGVLLPDGVSVHVAYLAVELVGGCVVGLAARSGEAEIRHLLERTGAVLLVTNTNTAAGATRPVPQLTVDELGRVDAAPLRTDVGGRAHGPNELYLVNATSGTTGRPKCVMHTANRWLYFSRLAVDAGQLTADDVFASIVPAPYGFGLWSAHLVPALLGAPCAVLDRYHTDAALDLLERERVTVLAAVTTQLVMLLDRLEQRGADLGALRCVFTGGERVPYERAAEFEDRTGAVVLQFYGANETGAVSGTTVRDTREKRLRTAGRPVPHMRVRLFDQDGADVTASGGPGTPAVRGPAMGPGYWDDPCADAAAVRPDGWMLMGDLARIDADGYLSVVGRTADFVVRGGKNVSAPEVEDLVAGHPAVAQVAAVAAPDTTFGERLCAYVVLRPGHTLDLPALRHHLAAREVSREWWPEHLVLVAGLPESAGGKTDKQALRADAARRFGSAR